MATHSSIVALFITVHSKVALGLMNSIVTNGRPEGHSFLRRPPFDTASRRPLVTLPGKASSVLQDLFLPSAGSTTRHQVSRGLTVSSAQSEAGRSRLAFQAALAWNALPRSVREIKAAQQFKLASIPYTLQ